MKESDTPQGQDSTPKDAGQSKNEGAGSKSVTTGSKSAPTTNETDNPDNSNNPSRTLAWLKKHVTATLVVELLVLLVGIKVACIYSGQLDQMIQQNNIAHDAMVRSQRAWVGPSQPIKIDSLVLGPPEVKLQYRVFLKNFGPTVALNVLPGVAAAPGHDRLDQTMKVQCQLAEQMFKGEWMRGTEPPPGGKLGQSIFPTEERRIPYGNSGPSDPKLTVLYIVGCVFYRDQFNITRRTRFCFETPWLAKDFKSSQELVYCNVYNDAE